MIENQNNNNSFNKENIKEQEEKFKTSIKKMNDFKYRSFKQIINSFYNEEIDCVGEEQDTDLTKYKGDINIEPEIIYDKLQNDIKVQFRIGKQKMYKIKDLSLFCDHMAKREVFKYGNKLEFKHVPQAFNEQSQELLDFILKYAEIIKYVNSSANANYRYYGKALNESSIILNGAGLDEIFEILKNKNVFFEKDFNKIVVEFVPSNPKIEFYLEKKESNEYMIVPSIDIYKVNILKGKDYTYILQENKLYRCDDNYTKTTIKLLEIFRQNYFKEVVLGEQQLKELFSIVVPKVKNSIKLKGIEESEIEKYKPKELIVKLFFDFDKNNYLIADVKFCYEDEEFNPLEQNIKIKATRNIVEETKALNIIRRSGFMYNPNNLKFILPNEEKIYEFLTNDINYYLKKYDVLVTDNFKKKQIKQPKIGSIGLKVENNLLSIDLNDININLDELKDIMRSYDLKKKYHRLKNGEFLSLEENKDVEFLDKLVKGTNIDYKDLEQGTVNLPVYRTLYLDKILKDINNTQVIKNTEYKKMAQGLDKDKIEEEVQIPKEFENVLRYYQKAGFKWLKVLDKYGFGGILADDMGLGKTIQLLSVVTAYINSVSLNERKTSFVVSPSSLTLNWQSEANKFAKNLKTLVIQGNAQERKEKIQNLDNYDLVITSYDLLKRDIELYIKKNYCFKYIIADEAQYLKNSNTQNAKSIKEIKADTRYALTGTPIENSLAELWSIFDFIMPGYLFSYKIFKNLYEVPIVKDTDLSAMRKLKILIEPFVLRRTKKEVLTELPDKTVTILKNEMKDEQEKIYLSYLADAKEEVANEININGYERSQIKILAALTRLRQICCHPGLFIDGYTEGSSKLEQCIEILKDGVASGHKILLFSGYTSMFEFIEEELNKNNIKYFKLTGATKVEERIDLVNKFNEDKDIKVFLISLKAGGTGLNLTGADMVIHYDPWWNSSAENQATDRAYRIGQKNNVQVYKLITENSIEEKIYELQQKKLELIENMLDTETTFINKLSKEDIINLFN